MRTSPDDRGAPSRPIAASVWPPAVERTLHAAPGVTEAIVLSRFDYGEADRILTLITPGGGKIKAIAKGIRKPTSRIGGIVEPFAELRLALAQGRTFDVITQVEVSTHGSHARRPRVVRDRLVPGGAGQRHARGAPRRRDVYLLLKRAYEILDAGMAPGRSPGGSRCTSPTSSACDRRSIAAWRAAASSRRTSATAGSRRSAACCASAARVRRSSVRLSLDGPQAPEGVPARMSRRCGAPGPPEIEREVELAMREFRVSPSTGPRSLAFLDECPRRAAEGPSTAGLSAMAIGQLRDIVDRRSSTALVPGARPGGPEFVACLGFVSPTPVRQPPGGALPGSGRSARRPVDALA